MATHEILTLQLGGYANFVGAHFWNFQVRLAARRRPPASRRGASLCGAGRYGVHTRRQDTRRTDCIVRVALCVLSIALGAGG